MKKCQKSIENIEAAAIGGMKKKGENEMAWKRNDEGGEKPHSDKRS